jgi:amidohydrolase
MSALRQIIQEYRDLIIQIRRDLHRIPEIAFQETKTAAYLKQYLSRFDLEVISDIAENGIVATMKTDRSGPTILFRADMDALPLEEATNLSFASTHPGAMHACGHDAHMTMVLAAATVLDRLRSDLCGNIKFLFQPAEEGPGGAKPMIEAGVLNDPPVDYVFGCHVWPEIPEGTIGVRSGSFMAAMDRFEIKIFGKGGHGAMPHMCVDALEVATQVVNAFQRVVSRQSDPLSPTVVTVGSLHAGTAHNIIPSVAEMSGTTRTFDTEIWAHWEKRLDKIIKGVCDSMGADYALNYCPGYPVTVNDPEMSQLVERCAAAVVGSEQVVVPAKTMGGEDFAFFLEEAKGCYFALGARRPDGASVHNPEFDFNEDILLTGVETYCRIALELLTNT